MLAVKMAATAALVVTASVIAERVGALAATLPAASGPACVLLRWTTTPVSSPTAG
jgi:hypothetical protein